MAAVRVAPCQLCCVTCCLASARQGCPWAFATVPSGRFRVSAHFARCCHCLLPLSASRPVPIKVQDRPCPGIQPTLSSSSSHRFNRRDHLRFVISTLRLSLSVAVLVRARPSLSPPSAGPPLFHWGPLPTRHRHRVTASSKPGRSELGAPFDLGPSTFGPLSRTSTCSACPGKRSHLRMLSARKAASFFLLVSTSVASSQVPETSRPLRPS